MPSTTFFTLSDFQNIISTIFKFAIDNFLGIGLILGSITGLIIVSIMINHALYDKGLNDFASGRNTRSQKYFWRNKRW